MVFVPHSKFASPQATGFFAAKPRLPLAVALLLGLSVDVLIVVCLAIFSSWIYASLTDIPNNPNAPLEMVVAAATYFAAVAGYRKLYAWDTLRDFASSLRSMTFVWIATISILAMLGFMLKLGPHFSRGGALSFSIIGWIGLASWRWLLAWMIAKWAMLSSFAGRRAVLFFDAAHSSALRDRLAMLRYNGHDIVQTIEITAANEPVANILSRTVELIRRDGDISAAFLMVDWKRRDLVEIIVNALRVSPVSVRMLPDATLAYLADRPTASMGRSEVKILQAEPLSFESRLVKRSIDLALSATGLVLLSPLMAGIALAVKCTSAGPVFFVQERNGFNDRRFRIYKFRSMTVDNSEATPRQATQDDDRITRIGNFLRRSSLDELPQLWNVLRGDMSLVGPRPHAVAHNSEYERLIANYAFRHHVKPGLTGWAQVQGFRGETATVDLMAGRVDRDLWYIDNWSLLLDLKILAMTAWKVWRQPQAY